MSEQSPDWKNRLDAAIRSFGGDRTVQVTPAKIETFLNETQDLELPASERLRKLAIALEYRQFEEGWQGLHKIYRAAAEANPRDTNIFHSWGISALHAFEVKWGTEKADRMAIASEAEQVLAKALELAPRSSPAAYTLGLVYYNYLSLVYEDEQSRLEDTAGYHAKAITWFRKALEWDPDNVWAQLYLAHCYHDEKDWGRAIEAYEKVDQERLVREWPHRRWRALKCREQLAACYAWNGNEEEAVRRFSRFLDEVEAMDDKTEEEAVVNLDELVEAVTQKLDHPELLQRTRALAERLDAKHRRYAKRYRKFFPE
jgi:tetratricopeptide (TPR) repeat protein